MNGGCETDRYFSGIAYYMSTSIDKIFMKPSVSLHIMAYRTAHEMVVTVHIYIYVYICNYIP